MRNRLLTCFLFVSFICSGQTKADSLKQILEWSKWYDLEFIMPEADSMLNDLKDYNEVYKKMHSRLPTNDIPYPFAFHPAPYGFKIPSVQRKMDWLLPGNVNLPANRNDLAFYSIPELASLIKNKKISSVELTEFFIDRLKKWGDTLQSVITLTEDLALQEAAKADAEIKAGKYRGPLHGIPYGLKDL